MGWKETVAEGGLVDTNKQVNSTDLYNDHNVSVKQYETTEISETRGLTKEAAIAAAGVTDTVVSQTYTRVVNGENVAIQVKTGSIVRVAAGRVNEADGWMLTTSTTTYTHSDLTGWATSGAAPTSLTYTLVNKGSKKTPIFNEKGSTGAVYQIAVTTEEVCRGLTQAKATASVTSSSNVVGTVYYRVINGDLFSFNAQTGTEVSVTATRESDGTYTATKTTTVYSTSNIGDDWKTAFEGTGVEVNTSKHIASSILFSKNGAQTIYQVETEEVTEYRGCGGVGALGLVVLSDNTSNTQYWAMIDGEVFSINLTGGTRTSWSASRNADGVWTATKRVVTFSTNPTTISTPWGTTKLDQNGYAAALTESGVEHQTFYEKSFAYEWAVANDVLLTYVDRRESVIEYISTKAAAEAIVSARAANTVTYKTVGHLLYVFIVPVYVWREVPVGTITVASASYAGAEKGWTVRVSSQTFGYTGWDE